MLETLVHEINLVTLKLYEDDCFSHVFQDFLQQNLVSEKGGSILKQ